MRALAVNTSYRRLTGAMSVLVILLAMASPVRAERSPSELLAKAVAPYDPSSQRLLFLRAAGVDSELDADEFANAQNERSGAAGLLRPFDRWKSVEGFDRNGNKTLDWFEFDAYRRALRSTVLLMFDANKDQRLSGPEQASAAKALLAGEVNLHGRTTTTRRPGLAPSADDSPRQTPPANDGNPFGHSPQVTEDSERRIQVYWTKKRAELVDKHDRNGDGRIDGHERDDYMNDMRSAIQARVLEMFDNNRNGALDDDERLALASYQQERVSLRRRLSMQRRNEYIERYDRDGDGELNQDERVAAQEISRDESRRRIDSNGDGVISEDEMRYRFGYRFDNRSQEPGDDRD